MADNDLVLNVKQIAQYPRPTSIRPTDVLLMQQDTMGSGPLGGPYVSVTPIDFARMAFATEGWLQLAPAPAGGITFNGAALAFSNGSFQLTEDVHVPSLHSDGDIFVNGIALANQEWVAGLFDTVVENSVWSFNGRQGAVLLERDDILRAGAAPIWDAHFGGHITAPTSWNVYANDDTVATVKWVQQWACSSGLVVSSINGRGGAITLNADDISIALASTPGTYALANTPPLGDASRRIANTLFVDSSLEDIRAWVTQQFETHNQVLEHNFALLDSPNFVGVPTAPTANPGTNTGQLATTAFVQAAVAASTTGVSSFNGRTGAVVLDSADLVTAGAATLNSPAFTGTPSAPTAAPGNSSAQLATTAFVAAAVAAINSGVTTFNTRTGAVTLLLADVTGVGGAPIASPALSGSPTAPTPAPTSNSTAIATTAFVQGLLAALPSPVVSFNGRTGAVSLIGADVSAAGGALTASPAFTGTPTAPTAIAGTATTQIATTAFVQAAISGATAGVSSFNGRSGAVTLTTADITGAGGAPLASPAFTGTPTAPTPTLGTNSTQLATTAYVTAAIAAINGVSSFNTRTGAITLNSGDISAAGGALIASPTFTGTPAAPTAGPGTNTTQLATTAFVTNALAGAGGVSSFNGRAGTVTLLAADITAAGGALLASPALTGTPTAPTAAPGTSTTQLASTAFVGAAVAAVSAAPGSLVLLSTNVVSSAVASVDYFADFSAYDWLEIRAHDLQSVTEGIMQLRLSFDGSTFDATSGNYVNESASALGTNTGSLSGSVGSGMLFNYTVPNVATSACFCEGKLRLGAIGGAPPALFGRTSGRSSVAGLVALTGSQYWVTLSATVKGLRFVMTTGNIVRGTFLIFGVKK